ncbi:MAG: RNA-binding protein [Rhodospirillales bacterium]
METPVAISEPTAGRHLHVPERRCIATGSSGPTTDLIRFVVSPDGHLLADLAERLPGHGIWVKADRRALERARLKHLFRRAAKAPVVVADDLIAGVENGLLRRCIDFIGLARRAGQAVFGFEKVREWLIAGRGGLLLAAADGDVRDRARLRGLSAHVPIIDVFTADELGQTTGRPRSVHGVVAPGRLAASLVREAGRLAGVRGSSGLGPGPDADAQRGQTDRIDVAR